MSDISFDRRAPTHPWRRVIIYKESIYLAIIEKSDTERKQRPPALFVKEPGRETWPQSVSYHQICLFGRNYDSSIRCQSQWL